MAEIGLEVARSGYAYSVADAEAIAERVGYPCVLRPSFTLGGAGGGIAHTCLLYTSASCIPTICR